MAKEARTASTGGGGAELPHKVALQEVWQQVATFPPPQDLVLK